MHPIGISSALKRSAALRAAALAPVLAAVAALSAPQAFAAPSPAASSPGSLATAAVAGSVEVEVDKAELLPLPGPGSTVFIANPEIADVQSPDASRAVIFGRKAGETTAYVLPAQGSPVRYTVKVRPPQAELAEAVRAAAPGADLQVSRNPAGVTVVGRVATPAEAQAVKAAAEQQLGEKEKLDLRVGVAASTQVNLQIRVAEVSRQVTKNLGFNWNGLFNNGSVAVGVLTGRAPVDAAGDFIRNSATNSLGLGYQNGSLNVSTLVDALQTDGLATVLAEPNLTAQSGSTANFLAGGEFPIPVAQGLQQMSVEWKRFGVSVDFSPTVLDGGRISIRVRPEVSELTDIGAVTVNNIKIPAITVRRADTTVELASGQSFAIAGMFQNNMSKTVQAFPGIADLPVLGPLFRSSSFKRNQTELVIIVTPYIVQPVDKPSDLHLPTDGLVMSNDLEQILLGRLSKPAAEARPRLAGPAGFMLEDQR